MTRCAHCGRRCLLMWQELRYETPDFIEVVRVHHRCAQAFAFSPRGDVWVARIARLIGRGAAIHE